MTTGNDNPTNLMFMGLIDELTDLDNLESPKQGEFYYHLKSTSAYIFNGQHFDRVMMDSINMNEFIASQGDACSEILHEDDTECGGTNT